MVTTLEALHQAVIANPADRTVRLVYADALDETGDPGDAARAEFIRAQIEGESVAIGDTRPLTPRSRTFELFDENWLDWWGPLAEAAGLPAPHVPGRRVRDVFSRAARRRRKRPKNWPYTHSADDKTVLIGDFGLSFHFGAGFPEHVSFSEGFDQQASTELVHRWGDAMPVRRLTFSRALLADEWGHISGPHLSRLSDAAFDHASPELVAALAGSPCLAALTDLSVAPVTVSPDTIAPLVSRPPWENLRALRFTSRLPPDAVRDLVRHSTLESLEELDVLLGNPGALGSILMQTLSDLVRRIAQAALFPRATELRWADYGPAFEALAAAPWVRRLRRLKLTTGAENLLSLVLGSRFSGADEDPAALIPDLAVLALADAVNTDKLEALVLPAAAVSPSLRGALESRLGSRVAFC